MSFEDDLRARLRDLADAEPSWPDPTAAVRERTTADSDASAPAPTATAGTGAGSSPAPTELAPRRRRAWKYLPGSVAAGVLLAAIVAGITYVATRDDVGSSASSGAGGAAVAGRPDDNAANSGDPGTRNGTAALPTCGEAPTSTGPLAAIAAIGPPGRDLGAAGGIGQDGAAMASTSVSAPLTFTAAGPTMLARPAQVFVLQNGQIVGRADGASPQVIERVPVVPNSTTYPGAQWQVPACDGTPLPAGAYTLIVVYPYTVGEDSTPYQLVSAPVPWSFP